MIACTVYLAPMEQTIDAALAFAPDIARVAAAAAYYPSCRATPLRRIGTEGGSVWIKDETGRMGLGSFKGLGGVYAVAELLRRHAERRLSRVLEYADLASRETRNISSATTFVCASAGNHGLAVATGARLFGAQARVHLPERAPQHFAARLAAAGAEVRRSGQTYEEACGAAFLDADETGAIALPDFSVEGRDATAALLVMEGYQLLAEELRDAFTASGAWPTQVFLQGGVGSFAAAVAWHIRTYWDGVPELVIVEPEGAACLRASHLAGKAVSVEAGPASAMKRLDCKTPSSLAPAILRAAGVRYTTITDDASFAAVAALQNAGVETSPSGAAGYAGFMQFPAPAHSRSLVIVTEGADREADLHYQQ